MSRNNTRSPLGELVLADLENLAGGPDASEERFRQVWTAVRLHAVHMDSDTRTVVATSSHAAKRAWFALGDSPVQRLVRDGVDGADKALLEVASPDEIARRYRRVTICSGDHAFAPLARDLRSRGVQVSLLIGRGDPARELIEACPFRIWLRLDNASGLARFRQSTTRSISHLPVRTSARRAQLPVLAAS